VTNYSREGNQPFKPLLQQHPNLLPADAQQAQFRPVTAEQIKANQEMEFEDELRARLDLDDFRTIRFALEEYYTTTKRDVEATFEYDLEDIESLRAQEDMAVALDILSKIAMVHFKIKHAAKGTGVDC